MKLENQYGEIKEIQMERRTEKKDNRITIRISEEDMQFLKKLSEENKISIGKIVRNAIQIFIKEYQKLTKN